MLTELRRSSGHLYCTVEYDQVNSWVYANWIGPQNYAGITAGLQVCVSLLIRHDCYCLLNDNRQVLGTWDEYVESMMKDVLAQAAAYGLVHFAHIVRPDSMAAFTAEMLYVCVGSEVNMRIFNELEPAQAWLHETRCNASSGDTIKLLRSGPR